ncbi:hypothetical protein [Microseira wollei]|uniref:Uncharacterized protein n=1 Tax=Microseira wollei NIES-4236 TaxID=2530354 RepID=A0AAV3XKG6_9CYAN|nr:hypothetical protein [Microseira wollei]GET39987.1 hypothetical protein MiSe_47600 [Microseira wollei NIES-4236]
MSELLSKTLANELYMADVSANYSLPKHYIWQSPLLLPQDLSDVDEFHKRVKKAGILWLKNDDLRPFNLLILTHKTAWMSYIFQRAQIPNQEPIIAGPIPRRLIRKGIIIPPYPLIFQESTELWDISRSK